MLKCFRIQVSDNNSNRDENYYETWRNICLSYIFQNSIHITVASKHGIRETNLELKTELRVFRGSSHTEAM
jgi:hypothetical protein